MTAARTLMEVAIDWLNHELFKEHREPTRHDAFVAGALWAAAQHPARSTISDFDRAHVGDLLVDERRYTNYSAHLLRLIARADGFNREALRRVYPDHVEAFEAWEQSPH